MGAKSAGWITRITSTRQEVMACNLSNLWSESIDIDLDTFTTGKMTALHTGLRRFEQSIARCGVTFWQIFQDKSTYRNVLLCLSQRRTKGMR